MNTTEASFENIMDDMWSVKIPLVLMIGGPIYFGVLFILIMCVIKNNAESGATWHGVRKLML